MKQVTTPPPSPPPLTKELWVPTTIGLATATQSKKGDHGGYIVDADNKEAITELHVPHDFTAIDEAVLVVIPLATLTPMAFSILTDVAAAGESYHIHSGAVDRDINTTSDRMLEIDIASALALIKAGDYVGVRLFRDLGYNTDAVVLGVRFKYN